LARAATILSESAPAPAEWSPPALEELSGRQKAVKPVAPAAEDEDARQRGFDSGYAEGLAAGRAQAESIAAEMRALLDAMAAPFEERDAVLLRELLALTERVARAVIGRELDAGIDIEAVLKDALAALGSVTVPVELRLNPADAALCRGIGLLSDERIQISEDTAIHRGGLQLRAGNSFVDASVEARIEAALSGLRAEAGLPEGEGSLLQTVTDNLAFGE
jgi:flagellar assembly protein FliH